MEKVKLALGVALVLAVAYGAASLSALNKEPNVGAIPGSEVNSPSFSVNGAETFYYSSAFKNNATTTLCSFKSPSATTTLVSAVLSITGNTSGTDAIIANAANSWATTTSIAQDDLDGATDASKYLAASTTASNNLTDFIVDPNTYLNFQLVGHSTATGTCSAILR